MSAPSVEFVRIPVTQDLSGPVDLAVHVITGVEDGPTLLLLSMLHGNEWFSVLVIREILRRLDPGRLRGRVIAVPVANLPAFQTASRTVLDDSDEPDANRAFGGSYTWLSNQLTATIERHLLSQTDCLIDYHVGGWGTTMADVSVTTDYSNPEVNRQSQDMARAAGYPVIHALKIFSGPRGGRTSVGFAGERFGIPGIVMEIGGLGFGESIEAEWVSQNVESTFSVMRHLGMVEGTPVRLERYLLVHDYWRVSPSNAGYVEPIVGLDRQLTEVREGEVLARVISPTSFEILEELRSPGRGVLFYACRAHMARPGGWGFGVANLEDGVTGWIEG